MSDIHTPDDQPNVRSVLPGHIDQSEPGRSWSVVSNVGGFAMGLVGVATALVKLSTAAQQVAGVLVCCAFTLAVWRGTHAWDRNKLDRWFAALLIGFLGLLGWFFSLLLAERAANESALRDTNSELSRRVTQLEGNLQRGQQGSLETPQEGQWPTCRPLRRHRFRLRPPSTWIA